MVFKSEIIVNPKYKKYELLRDVSLMILVVISIPAQFMGGSKSNRDSMREDVADYPVLLYYFGLLAVLYLIYNLIHYRSRKFKVVGWLGILDDGIELILKKDSNKVRYILSDLRKIVIIRGSTFHKIGEDFVKPYKGNNRLELHTDSGEIVKYEFIIKSENHNHVFEKMIHRVVNEWRGKVLYKSI